MPKKPKTSDARRPWYVLPLLIFGGVTAVCGVILAFICPLYSSATTALTAIGVAMASGGLLFWRSVVAEKQVNISQKQVETAQLQLDKSQQQIKQIESSNRNQTWKGSLELLASKQSATRIGGIESLYQITTENLDHYGNLATKVLKDFIRERLQVFNRSHPNGLESIKIPYEIYYVMDNLKVIYAKNNNDKSKCYLIDCIFSRLEINSNYADEKDLLANLFESLLLDESKFHSAEFKDINLKNTTFLNCDFVSSSFAGCNFTKVNFISCSMRSAIFMISPKNLHASFKNTIFDDCDLTNANLSGLEGLTEKSFNECFYYYRGERLEEGRPVLPDGIPSDIIDPRLSMSIYTHPHPPH